MHKGRRKTLKALSAALALPNIAWSKTGLGSPQLIITGAQLHSMDRHYDRATAVAVRGDRILAVGSDSGVLNLKGPRTKIIDARVQYRPRNKSEI